VAYGQTVLGRALSAAGIAWNASEAHSAVYDVERTAELFCRIVNAWPMLTGAAPPTPPDDSAAAASSDT
jgi:ribonuclease T